MKKYLSTVLLVLVLMAGISLLAYPTVSDWWNSRTQSQAIASYQQAVEKMTKKDYSDEFEKADYYNVMLRQKGKSAFYDPSLVEGYEETLDITGTGIMGYVEIEKIKERLPVYHGTDSEILQIAAGHLEGTSLPVGGEGTHCVISAHRGLPSSRLFTDLDELEEGDVFTITVLDRLLTYKIDQIQIVEPDEIEELQITEGKDYCTLMTCTPYGINTQRLLVRGVRTSNASSVTEDIIAADTRQVTPMVVGTVAVLMLLVVAVVVMKRRYRNDK